MGYPPPLRPLVEGVVVTMGRVLEEEAALGTLTLSGRTRLKERCPLPLAQKLGATEVQWSTEEATGTEELEQTPTLKSRKR